MDEDAYLENGVGIEVEKLNPVEGQKLAQEITSGNPEPPMEEGSEHHCLLFAWHAEVVRMTSLLLEHFLLPDQPVGHHLVDISFLDGRWNKLLYGVRNLRGHGIEQVQQGANEVQWRQLGQTLGGGATKKKEEERVLESRVKK